MKLCNPHHNVHYKYCCHVSNCQAFDWFVINSLISFAPDKSHALKWLHTLKALIATNLCSRFLFLQLPPEYKERPTGM